MECLEGLERKGQAMDPVPIAGSKTDVDATRNDER